MACGCGKAKPKAKPNGKVCSKCGWAMQRLHKYDPATKQTLRWYICSNPNCRYKEALP